MGFPGGFAAAVNGVFQRRDQGLHLLRALQVACLDGIPQVDDQLRDERGEADQRAVHALHHRRQQVFIVAGQDGLGRIGVAQRLDVARIFVHVALAHLERLHVGQAGQVAQQLGRIRSPRPRRIHVAHQVKIRRGLVDRLEILQRMTWREAKAQPVVRRHDVQRGGARFARGAGMFLRFGNAFADNRRNHGQLAAQLVGHDASHLCAFGRGKGKHLARMPVGHDGDNTIVSRQPRGQTAQGGFVDTMIVGKGAGNCGDDAAVIRDGSHRCLRILWVGNGSYDCGTPMGSSNTRNA
ncbi:hypothetical protein D3C87_1364240 [compost metagenome]